MWLTSSLLVSSLLSSSVYATGSEATPAHVDRLRRTQQEMRGSLCDRKKGRGYSENSGNQLIIVRSLLINWKRRY